MKEFEGVDSPYWKAIQYPLEFVLVAVTEAGVVLEEVLDEYYSLQKTLSKYLLQDLLKKHKMSLRFRKTA